MTEHRMFTAFPNRKSARLYGLNRNHHLRVWCSCMDDPLNPPGTWSERSMSESARDPRRLGAWDWLGVVDAREAGSAARLFQEHLRWVETPRSPGGVPGLRS